MAEAEETAEEITRRIRAELAIEAGFAPPEAAQTSYHDGLEVTQLSGVPSV
jgi:hypothetical protein